MFQDTSTSVHYFSLKSIFISVISQGPSYIYYHSIDNYTSGLSERAVQEHILDIWKDISQTSLSGTSTTLEPTSKLTVTENTLTKNIHRNLRTQTRTQSRLAIFTKDAKNLEQNVRKAELNQQLHSPKNHTHMYSVANKTVHSPPSQKDDRMHGKIDHSSWAEGVKSISMWHL